MPTLQASLRLSFSNILFPTDFSDASTAALPYAQAFARIYAAQIIVAHAVTPHPPIFLPMEPILLEIDGEWYDAQARRKSRCPVLTIGPKVAPPTESSAFRTIVFATDFSAGSLHALPYALSLAEENQAHLILLHVIPLVPLQHQESVAANARTRLGELAPRMPPTGADPSVSSASNFRRKGS